MKKYNCPCCGNNTLDEKPPGSFDICPVCYWEDDNLQFQDPNRTGGANGISLNEARENYIRIGAISSEFLKFVRPPTQEEKQRRLL
nr:CPCC family cysteine-rich protein [Brevibacillus dissolubilis]